LEDLISGVDDTADESDEVAHQALALWRCQVLHGEPSLVPPLLSHPHLKTKNEIKTDDSEKMGGAKARAAKVQSRIRRSMRKERKKANRKS